MPIYEYECPKCGQKFELRCNIAESEKEAKCPRCGEEHARRAISVFGIACVNSTCAPSSPT
jgi:putative FmdB family regulatory protein